MLYGENQVRDNIRNRNGKRVFFLGPEDQLKSDARDYLRRERIEILPAREARPDQYAVLGGGFYTEKPEHMTHLNGDFLVRKDHPRILFRGKMDSLQADLLLAVKYCPESREDLEEILKFSHGLLAAEVLEKPVETEKLCGLEEKQIRSMSHFPQNTFGIPHFMPSGGDCEEILYLNRARCAAREAELYAVRAFTDPEGRPVREDLLRALNRMSSMLYILMIKRKAVTG